MVWRSDAILSHIPSNDAASSQDSSITNSDIAGDQWDNLDFGDIEKQLASKLSDEDISGVLRCIDALNL
eukprot:scaffold9604_cov167-Skeletonema_dohrnii-CCMP3373.AAC.5